MRKFIGLTALAVAMATAPAHAAVVANSLPYLNTPDWTDVVQPGTSMTTNGIISTLITAPSAGVWFGYSESINPPGWAPGGPNEGNYLLLTAFLGPGTRDFAATLFDGTHYAGIVFNPVLNCNGGISRCDLYPFEAGLNLAFAGPGKSYTDSFIAFDVTKVSTYEILLKQGIVTYRINGQAYTGAAYATVFSKQLAIGDGSGSTQTGAGAMAISAVSFDNAPSLDSLPSIAIGGVPEPAAWAMLIAGFGLVGALLRHRRTAPRRISA